MPSGTERRFRITLEFELIFAGGVISCRRIVSWSGIPGVGVVPGLNGRFILAALGMPGVGVAFADGLITLTFAFELELFAISIFVQPPLVLRFAFVFKFEFV